MENRNSDLGPPNVFSDELIDYNEVILIVAQSCDLLTLSSRQRRDHGNIRTSQAPWELIN